MSGKPNLQSNPSVWTHVVQGRSIRALAQNQMDDSHVAATLPSVEDYTKSTALMHDRRMQTAT